MFRFLILCLILRVSVSSNENEGSGDIGDDEDYEIPTEIIKSERSNVNHMERNDGEAGLDGNADKAQGSNEDGFTTIIIIAAVSVVALAAVAIAAILLVRRHMQTRQQGVYSVPAEQTQKGAI
ncbi:uncharacterized protein si:dkey-262k9.2 [Megalops cyprinoides]|uniref:uncharacterized protein si:dkey-262k9.2 n=1 Tax=Megalops cyprinoides TaxID=118141 RepID=UPI00186527E4|nr:uncharacterized protein si:dkey-262k9.2 [Megalops cyprinoides]XP_036395152.1 uncharacterized protein si:dkey-262k9.2 [Megalops cyprinoides]